MNTVEKLTPYDKRILSRETILRWYRAKRLEKLKLLRDEIISLSEAKRQALKAKIIENTKRELAIYKKGLTPAQRYAKAKEFADSLFKFALLKKDLTKLAEKYSAKSADSLYEAWLENNKDGHLSAIKESPRYLAYTHLRKSLIRKEAFLLLGIIEKNWGRDKAIEIYDSCWEKDVFSLIPMWKFFTKERAGSRLGFYYGTRKIRIYKGGFWRKASVVHHIVSAFSDYPNFRTYTITGWWTVDEDEKQKNRMEADTVLTDKYIGKAKKRLQGEGFGDEYTGSEFLYKSLNHIKNEFRSSNNDSGLTTDEEKKVLDDLLGLKKEINGLYGKKARREILAWFQKQTKNVWLQPSREIINRLSFVYGLGTGNYLYRYVPDQKKIYILPIQGVFVEDKFFGGYIDIKNGELGKTWYATDRKNTKEMMRRYIETMSAKERRRELIDIRLRNEKPESVSEKTI